MGARLACCHTRISYEDFYVFTMGANCINAVAHWALHKKTHPCWSNYFNNSTFKCDYAKHCTRGSVPTKLHSPNYEFGFEPANECVHRQQRCITTFASVTFQYSQDYKFYYWMCWTANLLQISCALSIGPKHFDFTHKCYLKTLTKDNFHRISWCRLSVFQDDLREGAKTKKPANPNQWEVGWIRSFLSCTWTQRHDADSRKGPL